MPVNFLTFGKFNPAALSYSIQGGKQPYIISIDWGDGHADRSTVINNNIQHASHRYQTMRTHVITLKVADSSGQTTHLTITAVTPHSGQNLFGSGSSTNPRLPFIQTTPGITVMVYLIYLSALALVGLAWYDARINHLHIKSLHLFPYYPASKKSRPIVAAKRRRKETKAR